MDVRAKLINLHTHSVSTETIGPYDLIEIMNTYPQTNRHGIKYFSVGIHPWYIDTQQTELDFSLLASALPKSIALGECGLDTKRGPNLSIQTTVLTRQLELNETWKKPVIIHCVGDYVKLVQIKNKHSNGMPYVFHGFNKNSKILKMLLDHDFFISLGKGFFSRADRRQLIHQIPKEKLFLETDDSKDSLLDVYQSAAEDLGLSLHDLIETVYHNFVEVFGEMA